MNSTSNFFGQNPIDLGTIGRKSITADFTGGNQSTDAGLLLIQQSEGQVHLLENLAAVKPDTRDLRYIDHTTQRIITQRVMQIAGGYEDGNDSTLLRHDPIIKMCTGVLPESGSPLASQPTMSRFENSITNKDLIRMAYVFAECFISSYDEEPSCIVLDFDDTEDKTHGQQQLCLFNTYYGGYCYLPLHIYEGLSGGLISAILKPGKPLTGHGVCKILTRLIKLLRAHWKNTIIMFRGDSHFTSPEVLEMIEKRNDIAFITGLAGNSVLLKKAEGTIQRAEQLFLERKEKVVVYDSFKYAASRWKTKQRVIVKVERSPDHEKPNIRFIVTNAPNPQAQAVYAKVYCARGNAERYIKDHKTYLKSDRTSCHSFKANQFRLFLHSAAYVLIHALQRSALKATEWANATMHTVQLDILKLSARVIEMKTKIKIEFPSSCPYQETFINAFSFFQTLRC